MIQRTEADKRALLAEAMDPQKVNIYCGLHNYFGPTKDGTEVKPFKGCNRCWFVLFFHDIATTPPDKRAERMDELESVIHHMTELADKGKWDFEPYRHAQIEMESN